LTNATGTGYKNRQKQIVSGRILTPFLEKCALAISYFKGINTGMRRLTVLYIIDELCVGGAQELLVLLARHTSPECRSVICSLQGGHTVQKRLEEAGAEVHVFGRQRPSFVKPHKVIEYFALNLLDILRMCFRIKPDVIHCHLSDAVLLGGAVSFFVKETKIVVTKHTPIMLPERGCLSLRNMLRKAVFWFCYRRVDVVVAVSRDTEQALRQCFAVPQDHLKFIPNGVEIYPSPSPKELEALRSSLGLAREDICILNVGRLVPVKGQIYLIEAAALLSKKFTNFKLLIAGEGECRQGLTSRIAALSLTQHVCLLGDRQDVHDLLSLAEVVAFSSLSEGTSLAVMEAMAASKPIVATAINGNFDVLSHMDNAILVPKNDAKSLADALALFLKDKELAQQCGMAAFEKVNKEFSIDNVVKLYAEVWQCE